MIAREAVFFASAGDKWSFPGLEGTFRPGL